MAGLNRTWQGMAGHDMALQGMQGVAHMAGSDHSYESSFTQNMLHVATMTSIGISNLTMFFVHKTWVQPNMEY